MNSRSPEVWGSISVAIVAVNFVCAPLVMPGMPVARAADQALTEAGTLPRTFAAGKIELRDAAGKEFVSFKPHSSNEVKLRDAAGKELGRFKLSDGRLKAQSPNDQPLFELKRKDDKVMLKDAAGDREILKFKLKGKDIEVETPDGKRLYRLQAKEYGFQMEDAAGQTLFRAKSKDGKIVLRNLNDETVLQSKDLDEPLVLTFFRMKELTLVQQGACMLFFAKR